MSIFLPYTISSREAVKGGDGRRVIYEWVVTYIFDRSYIDEIPAHHLRNLRQIIHFLRFSALTAAVERVAFFTPLSRRTTLPFH